MKRARWIVASALFALVLAVGSSARAKPPATVNVPATDKAPAADKAPATDEAPATEKKPGRQDRVQWSPYWPKFRWWEYVGTAALDLGNLYLYYYTLPPVQPKWRWDNAFDRTIRSWLRADTESGRAEAAHVSDLLTLSRYIYPFGIDLSVTLFIHRNQEVTWQLLMMDLEAFAVAGFINNFLFWQVGRGRPDIPDCTANPGYEPLCGRGDTASFPSGHTLGVATAAGLTCVHHRYLPLYGDPIADASACVLMSVATVATGVTRIMSDRHFASDVLIGATIGFSSGYGLPWLLHYRFGAAADEPEETKGVKAALLPLAGPQELGLGVFGAF